MTELGQLDPGALAQAVVGTGEKEDLHAASVLEMGVEEGDGPVVELRRHMMLGSQYLELLFHACRCHHRSRSEAPRHRETHPILAWDIPMLV